jgi:NADPH-dependent curcumin reductase CurA
MTLQSSVVVLKHRSRGAWRPEDFSVEAAPVPDPAEGEVLVAARYITVDPYVRAMLDDSSSYRSPVPLGGVPPGDMVTEVVRRRAPIKP